MGHFDVNCIYYLLGSLDTVWYLLFAGWLTSEAVGKILVWRKCFTCLFYIDLVFCSFKLVRKLLNCVFIYGSSFSINKLPFLLLVAALRVFFKVYLNVPSIKTY